MDEPQMMFEWALNIMLWGFGGRVSGLQMEAESHVLAAVMHIRRSAVGGWESKDLKGFRMLLYVKDSESPVYLQGINIFDGYNPSCKHSGRGHWRQ